MNLKVRENDLEYYSSVTSRTGPAMTWSVTSIGYNEIYSRHLNLLNYYSSNPSLFAPLPPSEEVLASFVNKANFYFHESYQNAQFPFYVWTETPLGVRFFFISFNPIY